MKLSKEDILIALDCALERAKHSRKNGDVGKTDDEFKTKRVQKEILGAQAEVAFCRMIGEKFPATVGTYKDKPDIPPDWEVRWARHELVVRPDDISGRRYVLVTGERGWFTCQGWLSKEEAKSIGKWQDKLNRGRWAWFVHKHKLRKDLNATLEPSGKGCSGHKSGD